MSYPILYNATETNFDHNGFGILSACVSCEVTEEANGIFELAMQYPVDGVHFAEIGDRAIIKAKADQFRDPQLFRVYAISKPMNGIVTVLAEHISYDLSGIPVRPFSAESVSLSLVGLRNNAVVECPFEFWTDKETAAIFSVSAPASIRSRLGGVAGSIIGVYGGELEFDNYTVKLHNNRGMNRGVSIRYGKNLTDIQQEQNCASIATGVYPYWAGNVDGNIVLVELPEKIVNAPGTYNFVKIRTVDFTQNFETQPTVEQLRFATENYIKNNNIGVPPVSLTVSFAQLEQTEEYKHLKLLERVSMFDTVNVEFPALGVSATAKAVKIVYDVIANRVKSVTLGSVRANIADTIANQQTEIDKSKDKPTLSMVQKISSALAKAIMGANGGAVRLIDTNEDGEPDELYIADNPDPAQAVKVWRWNYEGWAGSQNGYNGPFVMGATFEDGLLAHAVKAANLIAGTITSADGSTFFLDLDNGILKANFSELSVRSGAVLSAPKITGQNTPVVTVENALADSIEGLTIYGKTTQNGTTTPSTPVPLESAGESGSITVSVSGNVDTQTLTASTPNGLNGVPMPDNVGDGYTYTYDYIDGDGNKRIADYVDEAKGVRVQRFKRYKVTQAYGFHGVKNGFGQFYIMLPSDRKAGSYCLCSHYPVPIHYNGADYSNPTRTCVIYKRISSNPGLLFVNHEGITTLEDYNAWLAENQPEFLYELAQPIETPLSAEEKAAFQTLGNPTGVVTIFSEADLFVALSNIASGRSVDNTQQAANKAQRTADAAEDSASAANGKAEAAQGLADAAYDRADEAMHETLARYSEISQKADGLGVSVTELRKAVDTKAGQAQVNEITEHFLFASDGLTITNSGTGMGINVSEKQVAFTGGNAPTTVITPNAMQTTNLHIDTRLDVGGFSLIPRSNENLSLRWTGG